MRLIPYRHVGRVLALAGTLLFVLADSSQARAQSIPDRGKAPSSVRWHRDRADPRWVHGMVEVKMAPPTVWKRIQNLRDWPTMFSDIRGMKNLKKVGHVWTMELESEIFGHGFHDYVLKFKTPLRAELTVDSGGIYALARMQIAKAPQPSTTIIRYSVLVETTGFIGWFISDNDLRQKQEKLVLRYLHDFQRAFSP
ncbi:MAG: hypothetical protein IPJ88_16765 [Myxococcales bacterium]|nr:MAG: hypothetical protein IPJ88_16765 [Myxococcales bacterium]